MIATATLSPIFELKRVLERVTYKEGWSFYLIQSERAVELLISFKAPDATGRVPGLIKVSKLSPLPPDLSLDEFPRWLEGEVIGMEVHEVREWLKLDGRCVVAPHG